MRCSRHNHTAYRIVIHHTWLLCDRTAQGNHLLLNQGYPLLRLLSDQVSCNAIHGGNAKEQFIETLGGVPLPRGFTSTPICRFIGNRLPTE